MEFDKPGKEVHRPHGNDVARPGVQSIVRLKGELRELSSVAAAVATAEEHATRVPPQKRLKWQLHIRRFEHCAASISLSPGSRSSPLSSDD